MHMHVWDPALGGTAYAVSLMTARTSMNGMQSNSLRGNNVAQRVRFPLASMNFEGITSESSILVTTDVECGCQTADRFSKRLQFDVKAKIVAGSPHGISLFRECLQSS